MGFRGARADPSSLASLADLGYQAGMTDTKDEDAGAARGRPRRTAAGGRGADRPSRDRGGEPFRSKAATPARGDRARRSTGHSACRIRRGEGPAPAPAGPPAHPSRAIGSATGRDWRAPSSARPGRTAQSAPFRGGPAPDPEPAEERIAKVIARAGIASRRDAEAMIARRPRYPQRRGAASPALNVTAQAGSPLTASPSPTKERTRLWIFHKPRGLVTRRATRRDARPCSNLPEDLPRVVAVGRLDINTEGLLLLTNDGGLARVIAHPDTGWLRRYRIRAYGDIGRPGSTLAQTASRSTGWTTARSRPASTGCKATMSG